jgi:hypothetical protein
MNVVYDLEGVSYLSLCHFLALWLRSASIRSRASGRSLAIHLRRRSKASNRVCSLSSLHSFGFRRGPVCFCFGVARAFSGGHPRYIRW